MGVCLHTCGTLEGTVLFCVKRKEMERYESRCRVLYSIVVVGVVGGVQCSLQAGLKAGETNMRTVLQRCAAALYCTNGTVLSRTMRLCGFVSIILSKG